MGNIKNKLLSIAEDINQIYDVDGIQTKEEIDEYLRTMYTPENYNFYIKNKKEIWGLVQMLNDEYIEESLNDDLTMPKLLEDHITKSYDHPLSRDEVKQLIGKMLVKFQQQSKYESVTSMLHWLKKNNFGDYQYNKWIRAIVDTLFKKSAGTWIQINTGLSIDQLTDKAMNYWQKKLTKESVDESKCCGGSVKRPKPKFRLRFPMPTTKPKKMFEAFTLNEAHSKKDIPEICRIAINNVDVWIDKEDFKSFESELGSMVADLTTQRTSPKQIKEFYFDFLDAHIDKFFHLFSVANAEKGLTLFLEENKDEIINTIISMTLPSIDQKLQEPEEDDIEKLIRQSKEKEQEPKVKDYSKMSQYDLQKEANIALDNNDFETLKKIQPFVKEGFYKYHLNDVLNEEFLMRPLRQ